jgi:ADP-heptose:LPS heptosyltransferase
MKELLLRTVCKVLKKFVRTPPEDLRSARYLLPAYTGLGNFILKTPMIRSLHEHCPKAEIYLLAGNDFGAEFVLKDSGLLADTFILRETLGMISKLWFCLRLRRRKIDVLFLPFDTSPPFLWLGGLLAGIPIRAANVWPNFLHTPDWIQEVPTHLCETQKARHEIDLNYDLLETVVSPIKRSYDTTISIPDWEKTLRRHELEAQKYVVVQVSVSNAGVTPRRWPKSSFAQLIGRISSLGFDIVLVGDKNEADYARDFAELSGVTLKNLVGKTEVTEVAEIIRGSALLVCHDSGLMHVGNALNTPLVALFGPSDLTKVRPLAPTSRVVRLDLPCVPCMANFAKTEEEAFRDCPIDIRCMRKLPVEDVYRACLEMLAAQTRNTDQALQKVRS